MQDRRSADGEAHDSPERSHQHHVRTQMEDVGADRTNGEEQSHHIQPQRSANWSAQVFAKAKLQQKRGESDGRHHHQRQRTGKGASAGIDHHQRQREQEQPRREDGPAAWWWRRGRLGSGVWQAFRWKSYTAEEPGFQ
jgi:hypothetical protein